jgi:hypothetical protein
MLCDQPKEDEIDETHMTLIEAVTALEILAENMDVRDQLLNEARI